MDSEVQENSLIINDVDVYGLEKSIKYAKLPMSTDVELLNEILTPGIESLAKSKPGTGHDQYLTGIIVQFNLTFSLKAWTELQRYHFIDFVSSQSTMHRISKFDVAKQCNEYVTEESVERLKKLVEQYKNDKTPENKLKCLYNIPTGFQLTARMTTNYRQLKTTYYQRRYHELPEWRKFCKWIETLPMADKLICNQE